MLSKNEVEGRLALLNQREARWDGFLAGAAGVGALAIIGGNMWWAGVQWSIEPANLTLAGSALVGGFLISAAYVYLLRRLDVFLRPRYFKTYFIEECDEVIKLHGSIMLADSGRIYKELLRRRREYRIASNAYERFGCTIAATPASEAEMKAKRELEKASVKPRFI